MSALRSTLDKINVLVADDENHQDTLDKIHQVLLPSKNEQVHKFNKKLPVSFGASSGGNFSVFGPTSAFHNVVDMSSTPQRASLFDNMLMNLSLLIQCLSNFFKWQYPDITTFIHRESFLNDFLNPESNQGYCSEELVYAIAALGAKSSPNANIRELASSFFETSRSKIFSEKVCQPQINTLQALLCLSLYELGDGNASASWMLSGMAIRMGYDLGFQMNPKDWAITDDSGPKEHAVLTDMDIMVRTRIYWGCYVVDHFVSLIMGRPVTVRKTEATVPNSEVLPNGSSIDNYVFELGLPNGVKNLDTAKTIEPLCSLSECVGALLSDIYSSESGDDNLSYLNRTKLDKYNHFLSEWRRTLPSELKWTGATLKKQDYNPTVTNYKFFYFVVLICLNRPFLNLKSASKADSPASICNDAIAELTICLSKFNESECPASTLVVYSSILATSAILTQIHSTPASEKIPQADLEALRVCYETISRSCASWKLASKSLMFIKKKVGEIQRQELSVMFDTAEEMYQSKLTKSEVEQLVELSEDMSAWANQDNLFTNFFEFLEH